MSFTEKLTELKVVNFNRAEPPVYKPIRRVSVYLSYFLIKAGVHPNMVSLSGFVFILVASYAMVHRYWSIASLSILLAYLLDCMDGEVARGSGKASILGIQLEHIFHWLSIGIFQFCLNIGYFNTIKAPFDPLLAGVAILSWINFYYLLLQIRSWLLPENKYYYLRKIAAWLFLLMPLDENLIIVLGGLNKPQLLFFVNLYVSVLLFFLLLSLFLFYRLRDTA